MGKGQHKAFKAEPALKYGNPKSSSNPSIHFRKADSTNANRDLTVDRARRNLKNVLGRKEHVPFKRYKKSFVGKPGPSKQHIKPPEICNLLNREDCPEIIKGRLPVKSCMALLDLLKTSTSKADYTEKELELLVVRSLQATPNASQNPGRTCWKDIGLARNPPK